MDKLNFITETYDAIENKLTEKLLPDNFHKVVSKNHSESFGSKYTVWKNLEKLVAIRLIWDGKDSWFIIEESPFTKETEPNSWADIVIVPFDNSIVGAKYKQQIINDLINNVK